MRSGLQEALTQHLGPAGVLAFSSGHDAYRHDETRRPGAQPALILRPRTTAEVSAALSLCNALGQPVVIQGGRTGLAGGARPCEGEIVLSLERMTRMGEADPVSGSILVEAGVPLQRVQEAAHAAGLSFGVDIGSRGTATIGGNIATNAGGIRVLRHGMFRAQVLGLEAVLADGTVLSSLQGLVKDNSGYDLKQLFIGSEGTLGVITQARLALTARPGRVDLAFCSAASLAQAQALLVHLRHALGPGLSAFEAIWGNLYDRVSDLCGISPLPKGAALYLIVEAEGHGPQDGAPALEGAMAFACEAGLCEDAVLAQSSAEAQRLWRVREACSEFIYGLPASVGHDVGLPAAGMARFLDEAAMAVGEADRAADIFLFGHLGDGNLHYIVATTEAPTVSAAVYATAARLGGAISAEHGIGLDKKAWLPLVRSPEQIAIMRRLKDALDPRGILNRGRIFDVPHNEPV